MQRTNSEYGSPYLATHHFPFPFPFLWLTVNLHHLFSDGAAFNTRSRISLKSYAISRSESKMNRLRYERDIASLVSELRLCVLNAAPSENRWWRLTANHRTVFTDEMRMHIAWDISPSPTTNIYSIKYCNYYNIYITYMCVFIRLCICVCIYKLYVFHNYYIFIIIKYLTVNNKYYY